jgi:cytochrome c peroxidase
MHDGSFATLEDVVDFYNDGGGPDARRDVDLRPLGLTAAEKRSLLAFLLALTGS